MTQFPGISIGKMHSSWNLLQDKIIIPMQELEKELVDKNFKLDIKLSTIKLNWKVIGININEHKMGN